MSNEAAERLLRDYHKWTHEGIAVGLDAALAAERRNAGQCDGYAGDAGASAPRCESYRGHPGRHFIRFDGTAQRRATVERIVALLDEMIAHPRNEPRYRAAFAGLKVARRAILDEEAAR